MPRKIRETVASVTAPPRQRGYADGVTEQSHATPRPVTRDQLRRISSLLHRVDGFRPQPLGPDDTKDGRSVGIEFDEAELGDTPASEGRMHWLGVQHVRLLGEAGIGDAPVFGDWSDNAPPAVYLPHGGRLWRQERGSEPVSVGFYGAEAVLDALRLVRDTIRRHPDRLMVDGRQAIAD